MKTIASALIALAFLTGVVAPIASANAATWAEELEKDHRFGHGAG
jgi:uncharacterized protein YdaT